MPDAPLAPLPAAQDLPQAGRPVGTPGTGRDGEPGAEPRGWGPWLPGLTAAACIAALALLQTVPHLPPAGPWALAAGVLGLLGWGNRRMRGLWVLAAAAAAVAWGSVWGTWALAHRLPPAWEGRDVVVEARIDGLPQALEGFGVDPVWRLTLAPEGHGRDGAHRVPLPERVSVWMVAESPPRAGERWRFTLRLQRVHALQNPGLPDAELWLLERGIGAQGSVRQAERLAGASIGSVQAWRHALRDRIDRALAGADRARVRAVVAGLVLGDQAAVAPADWALLRDAGIVHLFSISGLHITAFAWLAGVLLRRAWPLRWMRHVPAPLAARWGGVVLATGYAVLAGWGVPAQRTVFLLVAVSALQSSGRLWPWPLTLVTAALPIALWDPWALVQPGFWLSFVAVALLMQQGGSPRPAWQALLRTQAVATLGLAPLSALLFGQVSLVGAVANLVAVPLVTLVLTPLAVLGLLVPAAWWLASPLVQGLFAALVPLVALPGAVASVPLAPWGLQALALGGLALAALRLPRVVRAVGVACIAPLFWVRPPVPLVGDFELQVLDVGQGSAAWVRTAHHVLVFDTGPRWGPRSDAGARVLVPALRAAGVRAVDALVLSHGDADHAGGAASLQAAMPVGVVWRSPDPRLGSIAGPLCRAGTGWGWDGVRFEFLHPAGPEAAILPANASGCVLRVQAASGASVLIPADIGAAEERALALQPTTVLLMAHHGSAGSNSPALLDGTRPRLAFAQAGYRSRHGHPALATQNRLRERGIDLLTSADCGAWRWRSSSDPSNQGCWRRQQRRYWHDAPSGESLEALHGTPHEPPRGQRHDPRYDPRYDPLPTEAPDALSGDGLPDTMAP